MGRIAALTRNPAMIALVMALAITGCASKKTPNNAADLGLNGAGAATPGSAQDFTVNIGDRIFFDTDSTSIRADAQTTLSRQAQWLTQYKQYAIVVEGHADERGTH
jgi:peptidoglycan-associated lipoprotein